MKNTTKNHLLPIFAALLLTVLFVSMGIWIRLMAESFGTWQQVYLRMLIAGLISAVLFRRSFSRKFLSSITKRDWGVYGVRGFLSNTIGVGFFTVAIQHASLAVVSFASSLPILGALAWLLFREQMKLATLPFIGLSVVGLALLTGVDVRSFHLGLGEAAAIIALLGFDFGFLMARYHPKRFTNYQNTTLLLLVTWVPLFAISMWMQEPIIPAHVTTGAWIGLAVSSILNIVILYLINYVFTNLKAYVAGNLFLLEGVFALGIGFALYHEVPSVPVLAGAGIILACAYAISVIDSRSGRPEAVQSELE